MALLGQLTINSSYNDVAEAIVKECIRRGYTRNECIACLADAIQESGLKPGITSPNGAWIGIYQQDGGYANRNDPNANIQQFLDRFDAKRKSAGASSDPWKNIFWLQQAPGRVSADQAFDMGRQAYLTEIQSRTDEATRLFNQYSGGAVVAEDNRPDFNEFAIWSPNNQSRNGTKPDLWLLHTQEGGGGDSAAEGLANYLANPANAVSYHYTISQASDGGVTVVDCVDTDDASWSVLDANNRSINLCFAGSSASWTRAQWLTQSKAIDVAAYLFVQDAKKYGIPIQFIGTGGVYDLSKRAGAADHRYVTDVLKVGTHTDVGTNFPKDLFAASVTKYSTPGATPPVVTPPADNPPPTQTPVDPNAPIVPAPDFQYPSRDQMIIQIWEQFFGYKGIGFESLFGRTDDGKRGKYPVEALADVFKKVGVNA